MLYSPRSKVAHTTLTYQPARGGAAARASWHLAAIAAGLGLPDEVRAQLLRHRVCGIVDVDRLHVALLEPRQARGFATGSPTKIL